MNDCDWIEVYETPIGGDPISPLTLYNGQTVYLDISNLPSGYEFLGWKDLYGNMLDETVITLVDGGRYKTTIVCGEGYVAYTRTEESRICLVTVSCDANEGSVYRDDGYDICGNVIQISATPECCYEFSTWNDSSADRTEATRMVTVQGIQTYTATFSKKTFPITVGVNNSDLGTASVDKNTVECGEYFRLTATPNEGCVFDHWEPDGDTLQIRKIKYDCGDPTKYVAYFVRSRRYTITYHYNYSGSTEPDIIDVFTSGQNVTYRTVTASGYYFMGWAFSQSALTPDILPGETGTYTYGTNIDLYGVWQRAVMYECFYYGKPDDPSFVYSVTQQSFAGDTFTLYTPQSIAGYVFQGWLISNYGITPPPSSSPTSGTYTMAYGGLEAHAVWAPDGETSYTLTYDHGKGNGDKTIIGGIVAGSSVAIKSASELTITYPYHTFLRWTPGDYVGGSIITFGNSDMYLTAVWDYQEATITYDISGTGVTGTAPSPQTVYSGQSVNLADDSTFSRDGYTFQGWTTNSGSSKILNSPITLTSNLSVYPVWEKISKFTVTYNSPDCPVSDLNEYIAGATVTVQTCSCVMESGCSSTGWTDQLGTVHLNGSQFSIYQNMYLTPYFDCCEVTFKTNNRNSELVLNGDTVSWGTTYNIEDGMDFSVNPIENCCFVGWFDAQRNEYMQPCSGDGRYVYEVIPVEYFKSIDLSSASILSDNDFLNEINRPSTYDPSIKFIVNEETGEIRQPLFVCDTEEYDFDEVCGGTVFGTVLCERFQEIKYDSSYPFENAPDNYTSLYDFLEREDWRPNTNYMIIIINGVEYYYQYLDCKGNPMFNE